VSTEQLTELRAWYQTHKTDSACRAAIEARRACPPGVAEALKRAYPNEAATDEERELAFVFALSAAAGKIDMLGLLLANMDESMFPHTLPAPEPAALDPQIAILRTRAEEAEAHAQEMDQRRGDIALKLSAEQAQYELVAEELVAEKARVAQLEAELAAQTVTVEQTEPEPTHVDAPPAPETQPELVPATHVDVVPLAPPSEPAVHEPEPTK
jgi:hypothetical protein